MRLPQPLLSKGPNSSHRVGLLMADDRKTEERLGSFTTMWRLICFHDQMTVRGFGSGMGVGAVDGCSDFQIGYRIGTAHNLWPFLV